MFAKPSLLGGILALLIGTAVSAQDVWPAPYNDLRPFSRGDAASLRTQPALDPVEESRAGLAAFRPALRPAHMVRHPVEISQNPTMRPVARINFIPDARWDFRDGSASWTRAALSALRTHGTRMENTVPRDIAAWCPAYAENPPALRRAFWVGMMSALAKHESTFRPGAVGGTNSWFGLLQIYPDTARRYGCHATTGEGLKDPEDNLSCAIRIMNVTVPRDNAIALRDSRWRGVAADWGPMTDAAKVADMSAWTRVQDYCVSRSSIRPQARPSVQVSVSTMNVARD